MKKGQITNKKYANSEVGIPNKTRGNTLKHKKGTDKDGRNMAKKHSQIGDMGRYIIKRVA